MIIFFIYPYIVLQIYIFQHIQIDFVCVIITEMDEYTGTQQEEEEEMDIPNISTHELIPVQEDEDINKFITELFNENNTLPKCELDQWLEDYLEEMELHNQQQQQGEQSQEQSLLDMCQYSDISSVEEKENSPSSGQCKENNDENYVDEQDHYGDNLYNFCNCIFCSRSTIYGGEQGGGGGGGRNIDTEPVTIQCGGGIPSMYGDDQQQNHEKEQEILVGDDDLTVNCKAQPCRALLSYPFYNTAAHMEATPTREGI